MSPIDRLLTTLESGKVTRYHAAPTVKPQTVAQHSWGVAMIILYLMDMPAFFLVVEALLHDAGEIITGDMPYTVKRDNPDLRHALRVLEVDARATCTLRPVTELGPYEEAMLKVADTLDGFIWCRQHESLQGPVEIRWEEAYRVARKKFHLPEDVWAKADALFVHMGGELPK